jgi:hypothetical protein
MAMALSCLVLQRGNQHALPCFVVSDLPCKECCLESFRRSSPLRYRGNQPLLGPHIIQPLERSPQMQTKSRCVFIGFRDSTADFLKKRQKGEDILSILGKNPGKESSATP